MTRSTKLAIAVGVTVIAVAIFAPLIVSVLGLPGPNERDTAALSAAFGTPTGPSSTHLLGVDNLGRDVLSRVIYGTRVAVMVAIPAAFLTVLIGAILGLVAGFRGGLVDTVISRLAEAFLVIPYLVLAVGIASSCAIGDGCVGGTLRPGILLVILVIVAASWPVVTWVVRNQTATLRRADFVQVATASGVSTRRILVAEILPNLSGPLTVFLAVLIPQAVLAEAALTFIGVGVGTSTPSWGAMIASGAMSFPGAWWHLVAPGVALLVSVVSFTVLAEHMRRSETGVGGEISRRVIIR